MTEAADARKVMSRLIKSRTFEDPSSDLRIRATVKAFKLIWKGKEAGQLHFAVVSPQMSAHGALFGVYLECFTDGGAIAEKLKSLELSFKPQLHRIWPFSVTSLQREGQFGRVGLFGLRGTFSVMRNEDTESAVERMIAQAEKNYLPMLVNFVQGRLEVIDDVLANPEWYAYPVATIAIALGLAGKQAELSRVIGDRKLYDGGPKRVEEIIAKLVGPSP